MRMIPRCNIKLYRKKEDVNVVVNEVGSEKVEKVSVSEVSEEGEKVSNFESIKFKHT